MSRPLRTAAAAAGLCAIALSVLALGMGLRSPTEDFLEGSIWTAATLALALIGASVAVQRPHHRVGWLLLLAGGGEIAAGTANLYGEYITAGGGRLPYAPAVGWIGGSVWAFSASALLVFLPLYFPNGSPPTPRWRWVGRLGVLGVVLLLAGTLDIALFRPELMSLEWDAVEVAAANRPLFVVSDFGFPVLLAAAVLALLSLVVRFVRSSGEERQQLKLLVFAASTTVAFILVVNVTELPSVVEAAGTAVALPSLGIATMVAVLRYRLFEIDRIVSRTLTYGVLSVLLIAVYSAAVTVLTAVTAPVTGDAPLAVAAATLLAAATFRPARRRIQSTVDRRFNRARYDAARTVADFATSMRQQVELDDVNARLAATVDSTLEPTAIAVWFRGGVRA